MMDVLPMDGQRRPLPGVPPAGRKVTTARLFSPAAPSPFILYPVVNERKYV